MTVIEVRDLGRTYRSTSGFVRRRQREVEALRGISFDVAEGELFGLLGPNGAGKTTTIKILITLLTPTSGSARVLGLDVVEDARRIRKQVGCIFGGDRGLYERLSGFDNLRYFAELYGVPARRQRPRIAELLEIVGLTGREHERVEGYSRGMRQRLHIARGLVHDPPVLFLDEPTIGLDPVGAREIRALIGALVERGKTVLLTTHYMHEAEMLCDRLAVLKRGRIAAQGPPAALKDHVARGTVLELDVEGVHDSAVDRIRALPEVASVTVSERDQVHTLEVQCNDGLAVSQRVLAELDGTHIGRISSREATLEDAYVALVAEGT